MATFKYEIGDKFTFHGGEMGTEIREITYRFLGYSGSAYYIARAPSGAEGSVSEHFMDGNYIKVEPFFEVGKTYKNKKMYWGPSKCVKMLEVEGKLMAILKDSDGDYGLWMEFVGWNEAK